MESYLLGYCAGKTSKTLELPSLIYLRKMSSETKKPFPQVVREAEEYRQSEYKKQIEFLKTFQLEVSPISFGMYNAVVNTEKLINIPKLANEIIDKGLIEDRIGGTTFRPVRVTTRYGKFSDSFHYTSEYGLRVSKVVPDAQLSSVEFIMKLSRPGERVQGASFTLYKTGRIRVSAGYLEGDKKEAKHIVEFISKHYFSIDPKLPITFNNITSEFRIGLPIKIKDVFVMFRNAVAKGLARFDGYVVEAEYAPGRAIVTAKKKSPFLYIKFKNGVDKFTVTCSENGTIQVEGPVDGYETSKKFFRELKNLDLLKVVEKQNVSRTIVPQSSLARRSNMKPAPDITKRGTSCPVGRRPEPYSFQGKCPQGPNYYVRPNLQGQPCCYRIPKKIEYSMNKVAKRYAAANVKVPDNVRRIFGVGMNTNSKLNNVGRSKPNIKTFVKQKSGFMIGSRQAMRYSKVALVDIAKRMNLVLPRVISKADIAKKIQEATKPQLLSKKEELRITKNMIRENLAKFSGKTVTPDHVRNFIQFMKNSNTGEKPTKTMVNKMKHSFTQRI